MNIDQDRILMIFFVTAVFLAMMMAFIACARNIGNKYSKYKIGEVESTIGGSK
jgi:hypothetical protein